MPRKLRVLVITQYFFPEQGALAPQHRTRAFARHMVAQGNDVTVLCEFPCYPSGVMPPEYRGRLFERDRMDGFDIFRVWVKASPGRTFLARMSSYLSFMVMAVVGAIRLGRRFDVVVASSPPLTVGVSGWVVAALWRALFVLEVRDLWPQVAVALGELRNPRLIRIAEWVERFLYRRAAAVVAVTQGFVDHIAPRVGDPRKVHLIRNGTMTDLFHPERTDPGLRARLGLDGRFVVTYAGNIGIAQGLPFLLDLARSFLDHDDIRFLFIGAGVLRNELIARRDREGIGNVIFHDPVPAERITEYINVSDVLLVPLKNDPVLDTFIPSKMFDYLACRKPIILGVNGEARALLEKKGGGLYAEPENLESYRAAILTLRNDPALRERMAAEGYAWVTAECSREAQARQMEDVIRGALGGRS